MFTLLKRVKLGRERLTEAIHFKTAFILNTPFLLPSTFKKKRVAVNMDVLISLRFLLHTAHN